jgi:hypothetical protein
MPRMRRTPKIHDDIKQIARITRRWLSGLVALLIVIALVLIFKVGQVFWAAWMIEYRTQILGIILLILFTVILFSPVIIEVNSNPQPFSGPGKNPENPWDNLDH